MTIETLTQQNLNDLVHLVIKLWPDCTFDQELKNYERILQSENETVFLGTLQKRYVAFIHLKLRTDYVEGSNTSPVAYIEGLYVEPEFRKSDIGRTLVRAGESWGKEMGCTQYASDAEEGNDQSIKFHKKVGFKEANRIVCFSKDIA